MKKNKFAVVGGDLRNSYVARLLHEEGMLACTYAVGDINIGTCDCAEQFFDKFKQCDAVIGPIPFSNDGINVNAPFNLDVLRIDAMLGSMNQGQLLIGGRFTTEMYDLAKQNDIELIDLLKYEEMAVLNAIPTAEGAVQIAMEELEITLHGSNCLVLGYGRLGKVLAKMLNGLCANVIVAARKPADRAWADISGYVPLDIDEIKLFAYQFDVVFNTVPAMVLNEEMLDLFRSDCLLIDLASKPGGIDFDTAKKLGMKSIWALSLPGKVAPKTAAEIIISTAQNALKERER